MPVLYAVWRPVFRLILLMAFAFALIVAFVTFVSYLAAPFDGQAPTLYNPAVDVGVTVLNGTNFSSTLFTSKNDKGENTTGNVIWFVQFYNAWCGHCQHFAPSWKAVANRTLGWRNHIKLAVIDCAARENSDACNRFEIQSFPTMEFFPPGTKESDRGFKSVGAHTETGAYHAMLDYVEKVPFPKEVVALPPGPVEDVWKNLQGIESRTADDLALIVEDSGSELGKDVILTVIGQLQVLSVARSTVVNAQLLSSLGEKAGKGLWFLRKNGENTKFEFPSKEASPSDYINAVYAKDDDLASAHGLPKFIRPPVPYLPAPSAKDASPKTTQHHTKPAKSAPVPTTVNMTDLISSIVYMFSMEVSSHAHIQGQEFSSLRLFVKHLSELIPFPSPIYNAVLKLSETLQSSDETTAVKVLATLKEAGLDAEHTPLKWGNCQGSQPGRRGYPCSLWQLFHTLTVRSLENNENANSLNETTGILRGIFGYVGNFFSCQECRDNFMREANSLMAQTKDLPGKDAVLWLWRTHNGVNTRLAGDVTEDEAYPKIPFPSRQQCPACRGEGEQWNDDEVVKFLRGYYTFHANTQSKVGETNVKEKMEEKPLMVRDPQHRRHINEELEKTYAVTSEYTYNGGKIFVIGLLVVALAFAGCRYFIKWRRKGVHWDFSYARPRVKWM